MSIGNKLPYDVVANSIAQLFKGGELSIENVFEVAKMNAAPFVQEQSVLSFYEMLKSGKDQYGNNITHEGMTWVEKTKAMTAALISHWVPGTIKTIIQADLLPDNSNASEAIGGVAQALRMEAIKNQTPTEKVLGIFGFRIKDFDIEKGYSIQTRPTLSGLLSARQKFVGILGTDNQLSETLMEDAFTKWKDSEDRLIKEASGLAQEVMNQLGVPQERVEEILKSSTLKEGDVLGGSYTAGQIKDIVLNGENTNVLYLTWGQWSGLKRDAEAAGNSSRIEFLETKKSDGLLKVGEEPGSKPTSRKRKKLY